MQQQCYRLQAFSDWLSRIPRQFVESITPLKSSLDLRTSCVDEVFGSSGWPLIVATDGSSFVAALGELQAAAEKDFESCLREAAQIAAAAAQELRHGRELNVKLRKRISEQQDVIESLESSALENNGPLSGSRSLREEEERYRSRSNEEIEGLRAQVASLEEKLLLTSAGQPPPCHSFECAASGDESSSGSGASDCIARGYSNEEENTDESSRQLSSSHVDLGDALSELVEYLEKQQVLYRIPEKIKRKLTAAVFARLEELHQVVESRSCELRELQGLLNAKHSELEQVQAQLTRKDVEIRSMEAEVRQCEERMRNACIERDRVATAASRQIRCLLSDLRVLAQSADRASLLRALGSCSELTRGMLRSSSRPASSSRADR